MRMKLFRDAIPLSPERGFRVPSYLNGAKGCYFFSAVLDLNDEEGFCFT
jgi:hypothetical protein